jgi:hypothetical protein
MPCQHWMGTGFLGGFGPHFVNIGDGWVAIPLCGRLLIVNIGGLGRVDAAGVNIGGAWLFLW